MGTETRAEVAPTTDYITKKPFLSSLDLKKEGGGKEEYFSF